MREFYFKKTMLGMVLMVQHRYSANGYGDFYHRMVKATEEEANEYIKELAVLAYKEKIFDEIKKSNPELLI